MPTASLTNRTTIDALQPIPGKQYVAWDTELKGFGVRVSPAGTKTYVFGYRTAAGRYRWKTIGRVSQLALEEARKRARIDTGTVAGGKDPLRELDAARGSFTVREVTQRFLDDFIAVRRKASTLRNYRLAFDGEILPLLGSVPITDVGQADAVKLHESLRKTPTQANRVLAALSSMLAWAAKGNGRYRPIGPNPCVGIEKYPEQKRSRYLTPDEYARVGRALRTADITPSVRTAMTLLILTGARPGEIVSLQWTFVDLRGAALRLPDSKTGAKVIYLSAAAVTLLKKWPRHAHSLYVFPGTGGEKRDAHLHASTLTHIWADLRGSMGLPDVRLYDACRHSYASVAVSQHGLTLPQIGAQLGHAQPATTARYAHLHDTVAREHATTVGGSIAEALRRKPRKRA